MNIALHMEQLVLAGFEMPAGQRALLQASVEGELARLLTEGGVGPALAGGALVGRIDAAQIAVSANPDPIRLGQQIAQSLYGAIG